MLAWVKKQSVSSWVAIGAAVLTLVAMIIYIANSTTGYMTGSKMDALPVVFSVTENKNETVGYVYDGVSIMNDGTVVIELTKDEREDEEEEEE